MRGARQRSRGLKKATRSTLIPQPSHLNHLKLTICRPSILFLPRLYITWLRSFITAVSSTCWIRHFNFMPGAGAARGRDERRGDACFGGEASDVGENRASGCAFARGLCALLPSRNQAQCTAEASTSGLVSSVGLLSPATAYEPRASQLRCATLAGRSHLSLAQVRRGSDVLTFKLARRNPPPWPRNDRGGVHACGCLC